MAIVPRASRAATTPTNPLTNPLLLDIANNVLIVNNSAAPAHLPRPNPGRWEHQRAPLSRSFLTRAAAAALFLTLVLLPTPCRAGSGGGEDNGELTTPMPRHHHGEQLGVAVPVVPDVEIFKPSGYTNNRTAEGSPLLVFLHGFCLPDAAQQEYSYTAMRANAGGGLVPRQQTLSQVGLRQLIDENGFLYATPSAPHTTRKCALCNQGEESPNVADRLTVQWINQTLGRVAPAFECPSWDGSDACCNPELAGKGDDVQYVLSVVEAITAKYNVDMSRIYLMGIATGGFMVNRIACEAPEMFAGVATFAGGTWKDASRCDPPAGAATNVLNIHGDADLTVPIGGGANYVGVEFPSADATVDTFAEKFGCVPRAAADTSGSFTMPAGSGSPGPELDVTVSKFEGCGEGGAFEVEQWTMAGVDHFMEEETSRAMFAAAVKWLMPKTRAVADNSRRR